MTSFHPALLATPSAGAVTLGIRVSVYWGQFSPQPGSHPFPEGKLLLLVSWELGLGRTCLVVQQAWAVCAPPREDAACCGCARGPVGRAAFPLWGGAGDRDCMSRAGHLGGAAHSQLSAKSSDPSHTCSRGTWCSQVSGFRGLGHPLGQLSHHPTLNLPFCWKVYRRFFKVENEDLLLQNVSDGRLETKSRLYP